MKIIRDDIKKVQQLDKRYDATDSEKHSKKKDRLGSRITELRNSIKEEFDSRISNINERKTSFLDNHEDAEDSGKVTKLNERIDHINSRMSDVDKDLDPSLITGNS